MFGSGEGKGESGATRRVEVGFLLKSQEGGGVPRRGGGGRGAGSVSAGNLGGGSKYFFSGPKFPPRLIRRGVLYYAVIVYPE